MRSKILLAVILVVTLLPDISLSAGKNFCNAINCPNGVEDIDVCFSDPSTSTGFWAPARARSCGYLSTKYTIRDSKDFARAFISTAKACKRIKKLVFFGHGNPDYHGAGSIDRESVQILERYNCTMAPQAKIYLEGCNTGRSCLGQLFMQSIARTLLPRGGSVRANTSYGSTFAPGIIKHTSLDLANRVLEWNPAKKPSENWRVVGELTDIKFKSLTPKESCLVEIDKSLGKIERLEKKLKKCAHLTTSPAKKNLVKIRDQMRKDPGGHSADYVIKQFLSVSYYELGWLQSDLTGSRRAFEQCQEADAASPGGGSSRSSSSQ